MVLNKNIKIAVGLLGLAILAVAAYFVVIDNVEVTDREVRWLETGLEEINSLEVSTEEQTKVSEYLTGLIEAPELRVDEENHTEFVNSIESKEAKDVVERAYSRVSSPLRFHEGYWIAEIDNPDLPRPAQAINDLHIDPYTKRVTVYAQNRIGSNVLAPAQVGPGQTTERPDGTVVGFHPNAVYLNESGEELDEADGTGAWWVKHSWVLDGEGYNNWQLGATDYSLGGQPVIGTLENDGITMRMQTILDNETTLGGVRFTTQDVEGQFYGNLRKPIINNDSATYKVTRYEPKNLDVEKGEIDFTSTNKGQITLICEERVSSFDGIARSCPKAQK